MIKPDWSRRRPRHGQAVVVLNPGLSFGTGQHPTTAFCLWQIVENRVSGGKRSLLDIGSGSGILALAAAKLGYAPVHAFDNDPDSVRIAKANAQRNRVAQAVRVTAGDVTRMPLRGRKYSVVCANLIALLLVREHRRIVARVAEGGCLVLAGILRPEFEQVREVYERAGMKLLASGARKEWRSGAFLKGRSCIRGSARRVASA